jgi:hypothetical protein
MTPLQSFWPKWSYALPIGIHNHYRRGCVKKHTGSMLHWILGKHIVHEPPPRHVDIMAGISACTTQIPIASVYTHYGPDSSTSSLGALLMSIRQSTPRWISKHYFLIKLWVAPRRYTHPPEDEKQQSNLTQYITKNRPFYNQSRRRSFRQGSRLGGNYKEIKTCH